MSTFESDAASSVDVSAVWRAERLVAQRGDFLNGPGKGTDLRQRVDGLFEQQVLRLPEHPVAELPRSDLAQWDVEKAVNGNRSPEITAINTSSEQLEGWMVNEVVVDPENGPLRVREACKRSSLF